MTRRAVFYVAFDIDIEDDELIEQELYQQLADIDLVLDLSGTPFEERDGIPEYVLGSLDDLEIY
jgi:hypothetical protein